MKLVDVIKGNLKEIITKHCTPGMSRSAAWTGCKNIYLIHGMLRFGDNTNGMGTI